jgi:PAS domain S-box-containing protein
MNEKRGPSQQPLKQDVGHHHLRTEYSNDLMLTVDSCGQITYLSPAAIRTMGYPLAEVSNRALIDFVHLDDQADAKDVLAQVAETPDTQIAMEIQFHYKDGSWHILEMVCRNLLENVAVNGIVINCYDITASVVTKSSRLIERNRLQSLLALYRRADARIQDIEAFVIEECVRISASPLCFFGFVDPEETKMRTHLWSSQAMEVCAIDFKPVVFSLPNAGIWAEAIRTRQPLILNDYQQPDARKKGYPKGHAQIKRLLSIPIIKDGKVVAVMAVANKEREYTQADILHLSLFIESMWDILKRKEAEEQLRKSEIRLQNIIDCASDWIWEIDAQGVYTFCSGKIQ